jgi:hypothetical protein
MKTIIRIISFLFPFMHKKKGTGVPKMRKVPETPSLKIIRWEKPSNLKFNDYVKTTRGWEGYVIHTKNGGRKCLIEFRNRNNLRLWFSTKKLQKKAA